MSLTRSLILLVLPIVLVAGVSQAQDPGTDRQTAREQMWPAPTAEDWAKPCLITWQRNWEDAQAVAKETGQPILICVNMDGEIASEHYAGVRYRQPEVAALYEKYVCVIASTYRHNPRDFDEKGQRILCPRFGHVTCGEHIWIEPILFEKYFDGRRIAPRHIMIELDGAETYDVMLTNDVASVFNAVRDGIVDRTREPLNIVRGDRSLVERVASRDIRDRRAVEAAYAKGDQALRRSLLEAAKKQGGDVPLDLLRLAIFGLDTDMSRMARQSLAQSKSADATPLIGDALRVPMEPAEREALIAALERLGKDSEKAKWLASVFRGLGGGSESVDSKSWAKAVPEGTAYEAQGHLDEYEAKRQYLEEAARSRPQDVELSISLAEASLDLARRARTTRADDPRLSKVMARHMYADALRLAKRAEELNAPAWRVQTVYTVVAYYRGDKEEAYGHAEKAVRALPPGEPSWNSMAVLTIFAEGRWNRLKAAAKAGRRWRSRWLADIDAAYAALLHHPLGTVDQVVWHMDLMLWLGVNQRAIRVIENGLGRFPDSPILHRKLRELVVKQRGIEELEAIYEGMLKKEKHHPNLEWYAGYASTKCAESNRRRRRPQKALAAYDRAIAHYGRAAKANPHAKLSADLYIALALAGKARLQYEAGDDATAVADIVASMQRAPKAAATQDGVGISPADTAKMILARVVKEEKSDLVSVLETEMGKLDPELFVPRDNIPPVEDSGR